MLSKPAYADEMRATDLANVKISMTVQQAVAAISISGYKQATGALSKTMGPSFDDRVRGHNGRSTLKSLTFVNGKQRVIITFLPFPDGPIVSQIYYKPGPLPAGCESFINQLRTKYGRGLNGFRTSESWRDRPLVSTGQSGVLKNQQKIAQNTLQLKASCSNVTLNRYAMVNMLNRLVETKAKTSNQKFDF